MTSKLLTLSAITTLLTAGAAAAGVRVSTTSAKGDTHIEFSGMEEWRYDVGHKTEGGAPHVVIQFQGVSPDDIKALEGLSDSRVKGVRVSAGVNGDAVIDLALAGSKVNFFDYQTDDPANLVLDVYQDNGPKKSKTAKADVKKNARANPLADLVDFKSKRKTARHKRRGGRSVASVDAPEIGSQPLLVSKNDSQKLELENGIFDGGDAQMNRFKFPAKDVSETAMIRGTNNVYVHFPALIYEHPYLQNLMDNAPKHDVTPDDSDENMQVRLIIKLFNEKKYAVVLRTLKFFKDKYPNTSYQKTLDYVIADTYLNLWNRDHDRSDFETAMARYKEILSRYPDDPARYRTIFLIGLNYLAAGNNIGALAAFQEGIKNYPESPYFWQMRMAEADTLNALDKDKVALQDYEAIENDPHSGPFGIEARYRIGDVYFKAKDYSTAAKEYDGALKKYPTQWIQGPNLFFNGAEARFWTKDYLGALDGFREFLQKFPNHTYGGYAMTRIGEILNILGAPEKQSTGAYLESSFRYEGTPGAFIAKVHLDTQRFAGMKEKEIKESLDEFHEEGAKFQNIPDLEPFITLSLSDGYSSRQDFQTSNQLLIKYYQTNVLSPYLPLFKNRIVKNLTDEMASDNAKKNYVKALELFIKNGDSWFLRNDRIDTPYTAARAYEELSVPDEAAKLYRQCLARYKSLDVNQLKRSQVFENLPNAEELNLRLAAVSLKNDDLKKAGSYLGEIKDASRLSQPEQIERGLILSAVAEKEERPDLAFLALKDLTEHWKGQDALLMKPWVRMAHINNELKKYSEALPWAQKAVNAAMQDPAGVDHAVAREALDLAGDINTALGHTKDAIAAYKLYVEKFADDVPTAPVKYKLGKLYYDQKDFRDASQVWDSLKSDKNGELWAKMADEQLAQAQWNSKYSRYIDRKPAGGKQ